MGVKSTSDLANSDSNTSQSQQSSINLLINQPLSNSSILFNEDSMSSNCSSNNSFSSNFSANNKKFNHYSQQSNLVQKPFQPPNSENQSKSKIKDKLANEKEPSNSKISLFSNSTQLPFSQLSEQNKKTNGKNESSEKPAQIQCTNLMVPPKLTSEFHLNSKSRSSQNFNRQFLDTSKQNESENRSFLPINHHSVKEQINNSDSKENENDKSLEMFSKIYEYTNAFINQRATLQAATAAAMVAAVMNQPHNNIAKPKPKPVPLVIPQAISAFQKASYQKPSFYSQISNGSFMPHIYPNATLLKSPRLFDTDTKKQYTPPPMLSPFRKGPGLFYNSKNINNLFSIPNLLNNKFSNFNSNIPFSFNYHPSYTSNNEWQSNEEQFEEHNIPFNRLNENVVAEESESVEEQKEEIEEITIANLSRNKLLNQENQTSEQIGAFFPEDPISNEAIAASLIDDSKNTKPFINLGSEYQALIPEFRGDIDDEYLTSSEPEDLMWSSDVMQKIDSNQITNYFNLICKSSLVFGSSNNLELGLHILNYFNGDITNSIKAFMDQTVELPENHPITTYKYTGI